MLTSNMLDQQPASDKNSFDLKRDATSRQAYSDLVRPSAALNRKTVSCPAVPAPPSHSAVSNPADGTNRRIDTITSRPPTTSATCMVNRYPDRYPIHLKPPTRTGLSSIHDHLTLLKEYQWSRLHRLARRHGLNTRTLCPERPGAAAVTVHALVLLSRTTVCGFFASPYLSQRDSLAGPFQAMERRRRLGCCVVM